MILILTYGESYLRDRMDRNYWATLCAWKNDPRIVVHDAREAPVPVAILARRPHLIIDPYATPGHLRFGAQHESRVTEAAAAARSVFVIVEDTHEHSYRGGLAGLFSFATRVGAIMICYYRSSQEIFASRGIPTRHLPHHVDTSLHYVRNDVAKQYDVIYYGAGSFRFYAFRRRIEALLRESSLKVRYLVHPGYQEFDPARCGEGLALEINRAWIGICTCSSVRYLVAKYLEIPMNGAVVAGDLPDAEYEKFWGDGYIPLRESMADGEIISTLEHALADKDALRAKAQVMRARLEPFALTQVSRHLFEIVESA